MTPMLKARLAVGAIVGGLAFYYLVIPHPDPNPWWACDKGYQEIAAQSPDGKWTARGITLGCGFFGPITSWDNIVLVRPGREPDMGDEVLKGDWPGMDSVRLEWKGADHLQIAIPSFSKVSFHKSTHNGVTVELKLSLEP